jgi:putative Ca2+/H+ antiporter (TMEM165/GDT1 family)
MEALFSSTLAVAIAEIGDKTQLLSLFLAARFTQRYAIIAGIFVATVLNHAASAWLGVFLMNWVPAEWGRWVIGAFVATTVLFFLAEIGDKTQVATVVLAANYQNLVMVVLGSTVGMMAANVPVVLAGRWLMERMPMAAARWGACLLFLGLGGLTLAGV